MPITLRFNYKSEGDVQIAASFVVKEPDHHHYHVKKQGRPNHMVIRAPQKKNQKDPTVFEDDYLYISIESGAKAFQMGIKPIFPSTNNI